MTYCSDIHKRCSVASGQGPRAILHTRESSIDLQRGRSTWADEAYSEVGMSTEFRGSWTNVSKILPSQYWMQCFSLMPCVPLHQLSTRGSQSSAGRTRVRCVHPCPLVLDVCVGAGRGDVSSVHLTVSSSLEAWHEGPGPPASASYRRLHLPWLIIGILPMISLGERI